MRLIYLDQNHWIGLARIASGKDSNPARIATLELVRWSRRELRAFRAPSVTTWKRAGVKSAAAWNRLGTVMAEISEFWTIAPYDKIVDHQIQVALAPELPNRLPSSLLSSSAAESGMRVRAEPSLRPDEA